MSNKNIFQQDAEIPDIVQQKANLAFAQIYARQDEETAKEPEAAAEAKPKHLEAIQKHSETPKNTASKKLPRATIVKLITTSVAAVVTVAVVAVAIAYFTGKNIGGVGSQFTIMVCADELDFGRVLPMSEDPAEKSFSHYEDWYGNVSYSIEMPISVAGDNIKSVSYKVNDGCFQVVSIDSSSIVSGGSANQDPHDASTYDEGYDTAGNYLGTTIVEYYDSFSMDYGVQKDSKYAINIVNDLTDRMDLFYLLGYPVSDEVTDAALTYMTRDLVITVEVTFEDGTTSTRELGLFAKQYSAQDVTEDGTSYTYTVSGFFCYEINNVDEETKKFIGDQIACVEDYIKTYDLNDGKTGPDSRVPEYYSEPV